MSDQPKIIRLSLEDALAQGIIKPLPNNPNAGTSRGEYMVAASGEQFGAMRSIVLDRDGNIAAGNHTATVFAQEGIASNLLIIETDGKTLVAVKRNDMALDDPNAVDTLQYAIADNRASEVGLAWNFDVMQAVGKEGLGDWFTESELDLFIAESPAVSESSEPMPSGAASTLVTLVLRLEPDVKNLLTTYLESSGLTQTLAIKALLS